MEIPAHNTGATITLIAYSPIGPLFERTPSDGAIDAITPMAETQINATSKVAWLRLRNEVGSTRCTAARTS